jgi:Leucine-rich repeat (LRR) protein
MKKRSWFSRRRLAINAVLVFGAVFFLRCNLFGPEPGDPVFPAQIDLGDSAAIRAILDSNNLNNISVRRAIDPFSSGRIKLLTLDSLNINSFSFTHALERLDSLISLSLSFNKISTIKVPDTLKFNHLISLNLGENVFTSFPIGILKLKGVINISVENNKIATLPPEVIQSTASIYLDHNKLCSLTDSAVINWLDTVYGNWQSRQDCP